MEAGIDGIQSSVTSGHLRMWVGCEGVPRRGSKRRRYTGAVPRPSAQGLQKTEDVGAEVGFLLVGDEAGNEVDAVDDFFPKLTS